MEPELQCAAIEAFERLVPLKSIPLACGCETSKPKSPACLDCGLMREWLKRERIIATSPKLYEVSYVVGHKNHSKVMIGTVSEIAKYIGVTETNVHQALFLGKSKEHHNSRWRLHGPYFAVLESSPEVLEGAVYCGSPTACVGVLIETPTQAVGVSIKA